MKIKKRVVVVGAKFGELYLNCFMEAQDTFELVGMVATGSPRAVVLAESFGIPLYHSIDEVPEAVDIACVVVRAAVIGGEGNRLTEDLLRRGIHVIQEHPVSLRELLRHQQLARENNVLYWVNSFYPYTPAGRCLIRSALAASQQSGTLPSYANIITSRQLLFSNMDILFQVITNYGVPKVELIDKNQSGFDVVRMVVGNTHILLRLQNYLDPADPDMHNLAMHNLHFGWASGYLSLVDSYGPVCWTKVLHANNHLANQHSLYQCAGTALGKYLENPTNTTLLAAPDRLQQAIERDGPAGVGLVLNTLVQCIDGTSVPNNFSEKFQCDVVTLWQNLVDLVGPPSETPIEAPATITVSRLKKDRPYEEVLS